MPQTLKKRAHEFSDPQSQIDLLADAASVGIPDFEDKLSQHGLHPLKPTGVEILQINLGYMCNQTCRHCHVDAGPDRKEIMTRETMLECLEAAANSPVSAVDLTGGAPEMNPDFRWFVEELSKLGKHIMVRCNLTIIVANKKYHDLPEFYKKHGVEVIASLPYFAASRTDSQRGEGVFDRSVRALKMLNEVGYGRIEGLNLNLVYNPSGTFLPGDQNELEAQFKRKLKEGWGIDFNNLFTITNLPVSRFLEYLIAAEKYETYMQELAANFNPAAAAGVMCRNTISVGWDGRLYDCDFNQMLQLETDQYAPQHIRDFDWQSLNNREIRLGNHCYGCTAGAGSSCGGATV
jgi:radical SAM/Cys-rich protein